MSYTRLYAINRETGIPETFRDFRNAWGFAPYIWDALSEHYLGKKFVLYGDAQGLWGLAHDERVAHSFRAVLATTFDYAAVKEKDLYPLASAMEYFVEKFPPGEGHVNHLLEMAAALREIRESEKYMGACWYGTSVAEDLWWVRFVKDEDEDGEEEGREYNFHLDSEHRWVYDIIDEPIPEEAETEEAKAETPTPPNLDYKTMCLTLTGQLVHAVEVAESARDAAEKAVMFAERATVAGERLRADLALELAKVEALEVALARRILLDWNIENQMRGEPNAWPAQQEWDELVPSSQRTLRRHARIEAGLESDQ